MESRKLPEVVYEFYIYPKLCQKISNEKLLSSKVSLTAIVFLFLYLKILWSTKGKVLLPRD